MDPSFHVLTSRNSYITLKIWGKTMKPMIIHKHHHMRNMLMKQKHLQHPLRVQQLPLWMEWCSSNRWQTNLGQSVKDLGQHFNEVILVFDTHKADSLKQKTGEKRRQGKYSIQYQVADDTNIKHTPMGRFLSHEKMKAAVQEATVACSLKKITTRRLIH